MRERLTDVLRRIPVDGRVLNAFGLLLALVVFLTIRSDVFLTTQNIDNVLAQATMLGMASIGQFLVILGGGIDLSVGSVAKLSGLLGASVMDGRDGMIVPALGACLAMGALVGAINGLLIVRFRVAPFLATFGTFYAVRGVAFSFSSEPVGRAAPGIFGLYTDQWLGVPVIVCLAGACWAVAWYVLNRRPVGRHLYAVGGDATAAFRDGLRVPRIRFSVYVLSGMLAATGGFLNLAQLGIGEPRSAEGLELDTITAVVIGGVSLYGGRGRLVGVLAGVLLLGCVDNMMSLLQVDARYELLIKGGIILAAVAVYGEQRAGGRRGSASTRTLRLPPVLRRPRAGPAS